MSGQPAGAVTRMMDGNEAVADVAYRLNEVCAIYPITPSSTMAELADQWSAEDRPNLWGNVPVVVEMQSEGGAAGAAHGALQGGALTTTFTASQGLLLMIPNMYKIAGELTSAVFHVAARALAANGLSIFGDHQDVMAARTTGFALLASANVQEAHDQALISQALTLKARVPVLHFMDGFRTSHELTKVARLDDGVLRALIDESDIFAHRGRALNPEHPFVRGTAQNPDVYFQAREAANSYYARLPGILEGLYERFAAETGRRYHICKFAGHQEAEAVIVAMGSGAETAAQTAEYLAARGHRVGAVTVRLFRPFAAAQLLAALPSSVRTVAVLDRTKEPGATGEPLYLDVVESLAQAAAEGRTMPRIAGGRYGLSSKEFTPAMVKAVFDELGRDTLRHPFTVGIDDDVTHLSIKVDDDFDIEPEDVMGAVFFGLGADGTVGANKNSIKILGEDPDRFAQAYFVYDSKKSGSRTVSHLRFGPHPVRAPYLVRRANFVGVHQFRFLQTLDVLNTAGAGATVLLNAPYGPDDVWQYLPRKAQAHILDKDLKVWVIDAHRVAQEVGMGGRINTIMQAAFFAISGILPREAAIARIKAAIEKTYGHRGKAIIRSNFAAVDAAVDNLHEMAQPTAVTARHDLQTAVPETAPDFVREVTAVMMRDEGDGLPVSALPADGTYPSATARWEKRDIAQEIPAWDAELCIQCGNCSLVCPHGVIRTKFYNQSHLEAAPSGFKSAPIDARGFPDTVYSLAVLNQDCTGCGLCVEACPVRSPSRQKQRAINMVDREEAIEGQGPAHIAFFDGLAVNDRARVHFATVRGSQFLEPTFEFSGACAGCGETPYLKLTSQLFGDRMLVANATGCSSIYGGNLPTTPWSVNAEGRGPAWSNSLFEDNAEFGLGMRLAADQMCGEARALLKEMAPSLDGDLAASILSAEQRSELEIRAQRGRLARLSQMLADRDDDLARRLSSVLDHLVRRSVWIVGGDGWAYDIGYGGLDHVLASSRDVNILVMDTEVYSNTGGQMSKATPMGAVAKFAAAGKSVAKKDLALQAIAYGNVYVARVAMGANPQQTLTALREAEAYPGPSIILAYSHCIAHGINMTKGLDQQDKAVKSGYWPLLRYNPVLAREGHNPFILDSLRPTLKLSDYTSGELRYRILEHSYPHRARALMADAQRTVSAKWQLYEEMARRSDTSA